MTDLLIRLFIKDKDNVQNSNVRTSYGVLSSFVGIFCNVLLFSTKLIIGLILNSISIMADAFNNLSDAASNIISFVGVKLANRPADKEHPFGHGRYEYISAFIVAFLVIQVGFSCFQSSIDKILHPSELNANSILVIILCISILVKVWLGLFYKKIGKKIDSNVLKAGAADAFGDILITSATIISTIITMVTNIQIDGYAGVIVSLFVLYAGFNIAKDTLEPLLGQPVSPELYKKISGFVEKYPSIEGSHDLIVHNYGPTNIIATIHAEVSKSGNLESLHEIIDQIEKDASAQLGIMLVIHMDPIEVDDKKVLSTKYSINDIVKSIDNNASIHDFRMVNGEKQINLIFDLVVSHNYTDDEEEAIKLNIAKKARACDSRYNCVITLEHGFIKER